MIDREKQVINEFLRSRDRVDEERDFMCDVQIPKMQKRERKLWIALLLCIFLIMEMWVRCNWLGIIVLFCYQLIYFVILEIVLFCYQLGKKLVIIMAVTNNCSWNCFLYFVYELNGMKTKIQYITLGNYMRITCQILLQNQYITLENYMIITCQIVVAKFNTL